MREIRKVIGENLKVIRDRYGYSLRELGERAGISHTYISKIESGEKLPTIETLMKISQEFNVKITYFFNEDNVIGDEWVELVNYCNTNEISIDEIKYTLSFLKEYKNKFNNWG